MRFNSRLFSVSSIGNHTDYDCERGRMGDTGHDTRRAGPFISEERT